MNLNALKNVITFILAGGKGERLYPLTRDRTKPAVPFGGSYRIVDFTLSNCLNSNLRKLYVITQYKSLSLHRHLQLGWNIFNHEIGEFVTMVPAQQRVDASWYRGTADAIYQNLYTIEKLHPQYVLILSGDHIYKMDYGQMIRFHIEKGADMTVGVIESEKSKASHFGTVSVDDDWRIDSFKEKVKDPPPMKNDPDKTLVSMGIYVFNTKILEEVLELDSREQTEHDFGRNIVPMMVGRGDGVFAYNFKDENKKEVLYWRDVGTIEAYWEANLDLVSVAPIFNLYDQNWPIRTYQEQAPPAKFVFAQVEEGGRLGVALDSLVSSGCIISGGKVERSVLSPSVRVNSYSHVYESILMEGAEVGRRCRIRRAIIDKNVIIPPDTIIGYDPEEDRKRFYVSESGIVVIPKDTRLEEHLVHAARNTP
ncbi:MAG: glucose-1-phosphate adenylyltransferase [Candidatus Omnitrophica bacterium]|nr:glucose-1-phosphate adenylyltransferase [Candidatus Omnitrophota bacterium]